MTDTILPEGHPFAGLKKNHYRFVLADPPTRFVAGTKGRPQHYSRMTDADIGALPVADLLHPEGAWVGLWVTSPKLYVPKNSDRPPGPRAKLPPDVMVKPWGVRYSGRGFVWIKLKSNVWEKEPEFFTSHDLAKGNMLHMSMGYTTRKNAEDLLLFRSGSPKRLARDVHEVIISPAREHSRKPDEVFWRIERFAPGPYLELFARESRPGWDSFGAEKNLFDPPVEIKEAA